MSDIIEVTYKPEFPGAEPRVELIAYSSKKDRDKKFMDYNMRRKTDVQSVRLKPSEEKLRYPK